MFDKSLKYSENYFCSQGAITRCGKISGNTVPLNMPSCLPFLSCTWYKSFKIMSINNNWNKSFFYHSHSLWNNAPPEIKELNVKNALKITGQPIVVMHLCIIDINA